MLTIYCSGSQKSIDENGPLLPISVTTCHGLEIMTEWYKVVDIRRLEAERTSDSSRNQEGINVMHLENKSNSEWQGDDQLCSLPIKLIPVPPLRI